MHAFGQPMLHLTSSLSLQSVFWQLSYTVQQVTHGSTLNTYLWYSFSTAWLAHSAPTLYLFSRNLSLLRLLLLPEVKREFNKDTNLHV